MLKVGITGNIGSGKTTVSQIFRVIGIPVFYADIEARMLYTQEEVKQLLNVHFGKSIFTKNKEVDRIKLANIIFNDQSKLQLINSIIHPLVFERYKQWLAVNKDHPYTLHESAILFENKLEGHYEFIINVTAPAEMRLERIMKRDRVAKEKVMARIANQLREEEKNLKSDFVIVNDGSQLLIPQVLQIDQILKRK